MPVAVGASISFLVFSTTFLVQTGSSLSWSLKEIARPGGSLPGPFFSLAILYTTTAYISGPGESFSQVGPTTGSRLGLVSV